MKKRIASLLFALSLVLSMVLPTWAESQRFADVAPGSWYFDYVETAASRGWVSGTGGGKYSPGLELSTAQFATMLVQAFFPGELAALQESGYQSAVWWDIYVEAALRAGLLDSTTLGSAFSASGRLWNEANVALVTGPMTRYDTAQMLYNTLQGLKVSVEAESWDAAGLNAFLTQTYADGAAVTAAGGGYALSVAACAGAKLMEGKDGGRFDGTAHLTRAEAATIMCAADAFASGEAGGSGGGSTGSGGGSAEGGDSSTEDGSNSTDYLEAATAASGVRPSADKSDSYPTYGFVEEANANGYHTGASVDIGNASLVYEMLDKINVYRQQQGISPFSWVRSDAAEEYTLMRARMVAENYDSRKDGAYGLEGHATRTDSAQTVFDLWKGQGGDILLSETRDFICVAQSGKTWVITFWDADQIYEVDQAAANNYK